jgi:hypothetical protein
MDVNICPLENNPLQVNNSGCLHPFKAITVLYTEQQTKDWAFK